MCERPAMTQFKPNKLQMMVCIGESVAKVSLPLDHLDGFS